MSGTPDTENTDGGMPDLGPLATILAGFQAVMVNYQPVRDATLGYRAQLIAAGVGVEAADSMAADCHRYLSTIITNAINGQGSKPTGETG